MTDGEEEIWLPSIWLLLCLLVAVLVFWAFSWFLIDGWIADEPARGIFGDKFGAVNALFSGLAIAGLGFAIVAQRQELKIARTELSRTK